MAAPVARVASQEMPAPVDRQVALLTKVLQFDRTLLDRVQDEVVVAVLYQPRFHASLTTAQDVVRALTGNSVGYLRVEAVPVDLEAGDAPLEALANLGAHVAYIAPLRATDVSSITHATRTLGILSVTGVPAYVEDGVSIGISVRAERPEILINLDASLREGVRLSSELLKLAMVTHAQGVGES